MSKAVSITLGVLTLLLVAGLLAVELALVVPKVQGGGFVGDEEAPEAITVTGEGKVYAVPDMAQIVIGVESRAKTAGEAAAQNKEAMNRVMSSLKEMGIAEEDIQTFDYSIMTEMDYEGEPRVIGYIVSNSVQVKMRDLEKVGDLVDAATEAGANHIYGITFTVEDPRPYQEEARKLAVEEAKARATQLAAAADVRLGKLLSVSEYGVGPVYVERMVAAPAEGIGGGGVPVSPGQLEISIQVEMRYEILQ